MSPYRSRSFLLLAAVVLSSASVSAREGDQPASEPAPDHQSPGKPRAGISAPVTAAPVTAAPRLQARRVLADGNEQEDRRPVGLLSDKAVRLIISGVSGPRVYLRITQEGGARLVLPRARVVATDAETGSKTLELPRRQRPEMTIDFPVVEGQSTADIAFELLRGPAGSGEPFDRLFYTLVTSPRLDFWGSDELSMMMLDSLVIGVNDQKMARERGGFSIEINPLPTGLERCSLVLESVAENGTITAQVPVHLTAPTFHDGRFIVFSAQRAGNPMSGDGSEVDSDPLDEPTWPPPESPRELPATGRLRHRLIDCGAREAP